MSRTITRTHFQKEVIDNRHLSLVHFKTEWSGACHIIKPVYEELCDSYKDVADFFSIDVEQEAGVDKELGIREIPTILFFRDGQVVDHVIGLIPKKTLITKIEQALITRKQIF